MTQQDNDHTIVHRQIGWLADGEEESAELPVCGTCVPKNSHFPSREDVPVGACEALLNREESAARFEVIETFIRSRPDRATL